MGHHAVIPSNKASFSDGAPPDHAGAAQSGTVELVGASIVVQGTGTTLGTASPLTLSLAALNQARAYRAQFASDGIGFTSRDLVNVAGSETSDPTMGILEDTTSAGKPVRVELRGPSPALAMSLDTFDALLDALALDLGV